MLDHLHRTRYTSRRSERGQALLLLLVVLGLASGILVFSMASNMSRIAERADTDALALAQAKQALIGYVAMIKTTRPGAFPCPDTDNDGNAEIYSGGDCPGYVAGSNVYLGRLPWQTLGLPDLRDSSGERLWYAVSRNFALNPLCLTIGPPTPPCPDLTSDTLGQLTVKDFPVPPQTSQVLIGNAVAIVFAPGKAQGSQVRNTAANQNTAANYLEGENADGNNATFASAVAFSIYGPLPPALASSTFNDRLLTITNPDFIPEVEKYVANAMIAILQQYFAAVGVYPWADLSDGNSNGSGSNYYSHWRFPCGTALPVAWNTTVPLSSPSTTTPALPPWLTNGCGSPPTGWSGVIYYAVSKGKLENGGSNCTTCSIGNIKVGEVVKDLVLITPGGYTGSPPRNWPSSNFTTITGYFEDSANTNNDDNFVTPTATAYNRDRIYTIP